MEENNVLGTNVDSEVTVENEATVEPETVKEVQEEIKIEESQVQAQAQPQVQQVQPQAQAQAQQPQQVQQAQPQVQQAQPQVQQAQQAQPQMQQAQQQQTQQQAQPQPQPMPSQNVYRFQNNNATSNQPKQAKQKSEKSSFTMPKIAVAGVLFGVIAAVCFIVCTFAFNKLTGNEGGSEPQIQTTDSVSQSPSATSGAISNVTDVSGIVDQMMPSIVAITEKSTQTSYFGQKYSSSGAGSGFIVKQDKDDLLIVTNNHVVDGADAISVQFNDGETAPATIKGTSASNDLAVITVPLSKLKDSTKSSIKVAKLGNSNQAKVGQMVIAIGNALGYGQSVTVGYLSAKNREVTASDSNGKSTTQILLQTDAAINPGNSGGALIDMNGNVIGINSAKRSGYGQTSVEGMGYAIPMSDAVSIINDLMNREVLKDDEKGYLGITGKNITDTVSKEYGIPVGVYVQAISETGAAAKAGIIRGDVITKIGGISVKTIKEVQEKVNNTKVGTTIKVTLMRNINGTYKEKEVNVTLKSKDTLDGLNDSDSTPNNNNPNYNDGSDGSGGSRVFPWGEDY